MESQLESKPSSNRKRACGLSSDQLDALEIQLLDAPVPPRALTQNESLLKLAPTLQKLLARGHTRESISELLATQGLPVTPRAVGRALTMPRSKGKRA